ncbi:MAG TPA: (deoxy)nucleoside triphosphate pyrophosphohydrolase [Sedimentibacter sp.]|nr:(deoxy)nucleoside triphosphate pyrophosphohydrolase [Sedimentibacter sp.]
MKTIKVVAAVIVDKNKILTTQRGYGEFQGGWEFPGGKIEPGENPEQALIREIQEELEVQIEVGELIDTVEYDYPNFHLTMYCYFCKIISGTLVLTEHAAAKWLEKDDLFHVEWLPADLGLIKVIKEKMK